MGSMFGSILGRALGNNAGGADEERAALEAKNAEQKQFQEDYSSSLIGQKPAEQMKTAGALIKAGYAQYGGELLGVAKEGLKEERLAEANRQAAIKQQRLRDSAVSQATQLGLDSTVELLMNGGDIAQATEEIREQEKLQLMQRGGRKGRVVLAQGAGWNGTQVSGVSMGKYDDMSDDLFLKMLEGKQAEIKFFKSPDGGNLPYRVDGTGKVLDRNSNTWVNPSELGLSQAPQLTQEIPRLDAITEAMIGVEIGNYTDLSQKANDAVGAIQVNDASQKIFDDGIFSGAFANVKLQAQKALIAGGMGSEEAEATVANTETYLAHRGLAVANVIKAFGSGTGLSDADREYARQIVGGEITMDEGAMRKLLKIERDGYTQLIKNHNAVIDRLGVLGGKEGTTWEKASQFYIKAPSSGLSSSAQKYLN